MIDYRRDIDGLRGLAVLAVILSHTGISFFKCGFLGVDIFFVISGYLITAIISTELLKGTFSLLQFYMRRVRRIFPALFLVLLCCIPFAYYWMTPIQLYNFSRSLLGAVAFTSNFLFFFEFGYFDAASALKPLLHTWSLGVEEQFYLIYPVFILLLWRFMRGAITPVLTALILLSLVISFVFEIVLSGKSAFFLTPARVWELLCGAVVFRLSLTAVVKHKKYLNGLGALCLCFGFFLAGFKMGFATLYTALAVIGTCLLISFPQAQSQTQFWPNRLLSSKACVALGLISYSAYLWHQPVFAFARIRSFAPLSPSVICVLLGLILGLSYMSWRYVEQPFRAKKESVYRISTSKVLMLTAISISLILSFSLAAIKTNGMPERMPSQIRDSLRINQAAVNKSACHHNSNKLVEGRVYIFDCLPKSPQGDYDFVILGDSHADSLAGEIVKQARSHGLYGNQITLSGCAPFLGYNYGTLPCHAANEIIRAHIQKSKISTLIISARYSAMLGLRPFSNEEVGVKFSETGGSDFLGAVSGNNAVDFEARVQGGINAFLTKFDRVIIVYPIPEARWHVPQRAAKNALFKNDYTDISTSYEDFLSWNNDILTALDGVTDKRIFRVRPSQRLCPEKTRCMNVVNSKVLYRDADHLSDKGAAIVVPDIVDALTEDY